MEGIDIATRKKLNKLADSPNEATKTSSNDRKEAEEALRANEAYQRQILQTTADGFWVVDNKGRVVEVNNAYCAMSGYTQEEILGMGINDLDAEETPEATRARIERIIRNGFETFETRHRRKDGSVFPVEISTSYLKERGGQFVCFCRDITDRKQAEKALEYSGQLMRFVIEHANSGVAIHDRNLNYLYVSQRYLDMYNVQEQHVLGKHHYEVFPDLSEKWREVHQKALAGEMSSSGRDPYVREDGTVEYTRWECRPWYEADGSVGGIIVYTEVITDQVRQEQSLQEYAEQLGKSEENLRITLHSIGDAVISTDLDARVVSMNPVAETLTGWAEDEAVGHPLDEVFRIINEHTRQAVESPAENVLQSGQIVGLANHTLLIAKDGKETPIADSGAPIRNAAGETIGVVLVFRDQTQERDSRRVLEESEARLRRAQKIALVGDWEFNLKTGTVNTSESAREIYGLSRGELSIKDIQKIPLPEDRPLLDAALKALIKEGKPYDVEFTIRNAFDQTLVDIHSVAEYNPEAETVFGVIQDITERKRTEESLREKEALLAKAQEIAHTGSWKLDLTTNRLTWSDEVYRIFGCKPEEFDPTYEAFLDLVHPEDRAALDEAYSRSVREESDGYDIEHRVVRRNSDEVRYVHERCVHERDASGSIIKSTGMVQDVTERKLAETYREMGLEILQILNEPDDLQESIQCVLAALKARTGFDAVGLRLQEGDDFPYFAEDGFPADFLQTENTLLERGKDGGVCRDKDGNVCLECTCGLVISGKTDPSNPLFTKWGSCWTNESFFLLDLPSDQDPRLHPRNNCIHQGYASVALIPVRTKDRIVGLIHLNDKRKDRFTIETIELLEGIAAHIGSALMRKRTESELLRLSTAIEQSPETVVITDTEGTIQYVNSVFEKTTGYTSEEAIGQNPRILKSGQQDAEFYTTMWNTLRDGRVWEGRMVNKRKDGSLYTEEASIAPVKGSNGTISNYVGVKRDITAELKLQDQLTQAQKMESVGRLAGGVAHDFNNILMGIMGYTDMCRDDIEADHPIREWLDEITHEAERSAKLTRQLLAFARKQTVAPKVLDLNTTVADMLKMLRQLIGEDIDLAWKPGAELWSVKLDPGQVDQILANLCVNARDAIGGVGKVTIETQNVDIDANYCVENTEAVIGSYVMLVISDDGCGMDKDTMAQVFEPFFTTKGVGEGTGLGLSTVYGIVKQNTGFVNVYSELGKGTTFRIYLPRDKSRSVEGKKAATNKDLIGGSGKILVVEDERAILTSLRMFLERLGYTVMSADCPEEALRLMAEHKEDGIDLLITDVVMPGMSGRDLAGKLAPDFPSMKVLYMSGYTANVIAHRGILEDDVEFIPKPFSREELAQKVREVLK